MWGKTWVTYLALLVFCLALPLLAMAGENPSPEQKESTTKKETKEEKTETVEQLPQIEVLSYPEKAATSSVITKEDIGLGPLQNLPGYLEEMTGVDLQRRSLVGVKNRQMTIRGFDESRYQIYLNGRSWKGVGVKGGFFVDWSSITPTDLERLEIIRGPLSAEYSNTLGGAVIINTQKGSKKPKIYFDSYWGSWATQNYRFLTTGSKGPVEYSFSTSYANTDGYLRNNYVHDRINFNGSLTYNFPWDFSLTGSARYIAQDLGMIVYNRPNGFAYSPGDPISDGDTLYGPGINFIGGAAGGPQGLTYGDRSHIYAQRYELDLEAKQKFWYGWGKFHLFYFQAVREDFFYALNDPNRLIAQRGSWDEDTWGWNIKVRQNPGPIRLGCGLEGNYYGYGGLTYEFLDPQYVRAPLPTSSSGLKNAQKLHGGFVDASVPFLKYCELYLGLRYDNYDAAAQPLNNSKGIRADALSPKSTLTIRPTDTTTAYLSINFSTRFPTQPEFYWFGAGYQPPGRTSNSVLQPEFGMSYEAGVTQELPWSSKIKLRTYYYDINDYIRTIFGYRPSRVVYNLNLATFRGVEVEAQMGLPYNLTAFANYTWQQISTSPDPLNGNIQTLPELPEHKANIGLKYKASNGAEGRFYVRLVSHRYEPRLTVTNNQITATILRPLKGFYTLNLEGRYPVGQYRGMKGFLYFGVENLTSEYYEEDYGYPMPTATFYGGIQMRY